MKHNKTGTSTYFTKLHTAATADGVCEIYYIITSVNLPTQNEIATKSRMSLGIVNRVIAGIPEAKVSTKYHVHRLSEAKILKRGARSWRFYLRSNCEI